MAAECESCHASIEWAISPKGARSPIDRMAAPAGSVMLLRPQGLGEILAVTMSADGLELARKQRIPLHMNHWATCPDKAEWRAKQAAKRERRAAES